MLVGLLRWLHSGQLQDQQHFLVDPENSGGSQGQHWRIGRVGQAYLWHPPEGSGRIVGQFRYHLVPEGTVFISLHIFFPSQAIGKIMIFRMSNEVSNRALVKEATYLMIEIMSSKTLNGEVRSRQKARKAKGR